MNIVGYVEYTTAIIMGVYLTQISSRYIIIQEDLLKINKKYAKTNTVIYKCMEKYEHRKKREKKKNTSRCSLHSIHQTKNKTKKKN